LPEILNFKADFRETQGEHRQDQTQNGEKKKKKTASSMHSAQNNGRVGRDRNGWAGRLKKGEAREAKFSLVSFFLDIEPVSEAATSDN
jgi:hypothetical protein